MDLKEIGIEATDVVLYVGSKCNLRCLHCYIGDELLDKAIFYSGKSILKFLSQINTLERITVLGGEPLMHPEINRILEYLKKFPTAEKRITTNGTITKRVDWDLIKEAGVRVCISLDGYSAYYHDAIRGKNTFKNTTKTIQKLTQSEHDVEITHTVNNDNINDIEEMIELCRQLGVKRINLHRATPRGNAKENNHLVVGATRWRQLVNQLRQLKNCYSGKIRLRYELAFATESEYQSLVEQGLYKEHSVSSFYSKTGGQRVVIYPDGKLYISSEAFGTESFVGVLAEKGLEINQSELNELTMRRQSQTYITDIDKNMIGDKNYPIVLCVSYRESLLL